MSSWTVGEMIDFEEVTGLSFDELDEAKVPIKAAAAFVWLHERKTNPALTYDEVCKLDIADLEPKLKALEEAFAANPTKAG